MKLGIIKIDNLENVENLQKPEQKCPKWLAINVAFLSILIGAYSSVQTVRADEGADFLTSVLNRIIIQTEIVYQDFGKLLKQSSLPADVKQRYYDTFVCDVNNQAQALYLNIEKLINNPDLEDFGFKKKKEMATTVMDDVFANDFLAEKFYQKILEQYQDAQRLYEAECSEKDAVKGHAHLAEKLQSFATFYKDLASRVEQTAHTRVENAGTLSVSGGTPGGVKKPRERCADCQKKLTQVMVRYQCENCTSSFCRNDELQRHYEQTSVCHADLKKKNQDRIKLRNPVVIADKVKERI